MGLPCSHTLAEKEQNSEPLQPTDFDVHWWVDRTQAVTIEIAQQLHEPYTRFTTRRGRNQHQRRTGVRGNTRDPSWHERAEGPPRLLLRTCLPTGSLLTRAFKMAEKHIQIR